jgi:hypothetical protein
MDDRVRPVEQAFEGRGLQVELVAPVTGMPAERQVVRTFEGGVVVVGVRVDAVDLVPAPKQQGADVMADEARRTGHDVPHGSALGLSGATQQWLTTDERHWTFR